MGETASLYRNEISQRPDYFFCSEDRTSLGVSLLPLWLGVSLLSLFHVYLLSVRLVHVSRLSLESRAPLLVGTGRTRSPGLTPREGQATEREGRIYTPET